MESNFNNIVFVLLFIYQKIDIEKICSELCIVKTHLVELINKLVNWGLVDINENGIDYRLTVTGENIIKYTEEDAKLLQMNISSE